MLREREKVLGMICMSLSLANVANCCKNIFWQRLQIDLDKSERCLVSHGVGVFQFSTLFTGMSTLTQKRFNTNISTVQYTYI
jgi:hypothetical protein